MILNIRLTPGAGQNRIDAPDPSGVLKARVTVRPVDNAANEALVRLLSKSLRLPQKAVTIIRGATSRNKAVEVKGINRIPEEIYGKHF